MATIATKKCSYRATNSFDALISTHQKPLQAFCRSVGTPLLSQNILQNSLIIFALCRTLVVHYMISDFFCCFLIVCFTSYFMFSIAVLPHGPGIVYYHLLLRRETRIPGVAPFSFRIGIWDLFVNRGQESYTPTAFGKLWTTPGVRCMKHHNP